MQEFCRVDGKLGSEVWVIESLLFFLMSLVLKRQELGYERNKTFDVEELKLKENETCLVMG